MEEKRLSDPAVVRSETLCVVSVYAVMRFIYTTKWWSDILILLDIIVQWYEGSNSELFFQIIYIETGWIFIP